MNRGGLGFLDKNGQLILPLDFLEHLSVTEGGPLYGCYYPSSSSPHPNPSSTIEHDFMLTPVPPRFWSRCARLVVRLKHQPGALRPLALLLTEHKVAILHSECSRSGHRYSTWSFHVTFEALEEPGDFDPQQSLYPGVDNARRELEETIQRELCDTILFVDESDVELRQPVRSWPHTSLAYFHHYLGDALESDTFRVHCTADGVLHPDETERFYSLITELSETTAEPVAPAVVYADLDTHFFAVRLGLVPNKHINNFFEITVVHQRAGGPDTCLGLMAHILGLLGDEYTVWRTYNYIKRNARSGSEGRIVLLVEDRSAGHADPLDCIDKARNRLPQGKALGTGSHSRLKHIDLFPLTPANVRTRLGVQSRVHGVPPHAVFISFHHPDRGLAEQVKDALEKEGLPAYLADVRAGVQISPEIREAILNSQEMCVLCTETSLSSIWVATEWGAAWALGKLIVPVTHGVEFNDLPIRLSDVLSVRFSDLETYVQTVKLRRAERGWGTQGMR